MKFIGGDQTGVIVCFVNWNKNLREDSVIELHNYFLEFYQERSYEICSTASFKFSKEKIDKINLKQSISYMNDTSMLKYNIQTLDPYNPTLEALPYLKYGKDGYKDSLYFIV